MRAALDILKSDRNGGSLFKGCEKILVAVNVACQLVNRNVRQLLSEVSEDEIEALCR